MPLRIYILSLLLLCSTFGVANTPEAKQSLSDSLAITQSTDFVKASLLISKPTTPFYLTLGHCAIRMQCPYHGLDFVFSQENEKSFTEYFLSQEKICMSLHLYKAQDYIADMQIQDIDLLEYELLLPIEAKKKLWEVLDNAFLAHTSSYDYLRHSCTITCIHLLEQALGKDNISYDSTLFAQPKTSKKIVQEAQPNPWIYNLTIVFNSDYDDLLYGSNQIIVPAKIVDELQKATYQNQPILSSHPTVLYKSQNPHTYIRYFSPANLALLMLFLSLLTLAFKTPKRFDTSIFVLAIVVLVVVAISHIFAWITSSYLGPQFIEIAYIPIPLLFWKYRKYWLFPYILLLIAWCIYMTILYAKGTFICDWPQIVLVLSLIILYSKQYLLIVQKI